MALCHVQFIQQVRRRRMAPVVPIKLFLKCIDDRLRRVQRQAATVRSIREPADENLIGNPPVRNSGMPTPKAHRRPLCMQRTLASARARIRAQFHGDIMWENPGYGFGTRMTRAV